MSPRLIFVFLLIAVVSAEPQFGIFGLPKAPSAPADLASHADPAQVSDWTQAVQGIANFAKSALDALADAVNAGNAEPQHGGFGLQNVPSAPAGLASFADPAQVSDWNQKIHGLGVLTQTTLTAMGKIALADDPEIGARIVATLNGEWRKVVEIVENFFKKYSRGKRDISSDGKESYNSIATILVNSNKKIDGDKKKLKRKAQKDIDKEYRKGVDNCPADPCVSTSKALAEAEGAEDERQY